MRYRVALLIESLESALKFHRCDQTWTQWREIVGLKGAHYCTYKQALYLTTEAVMRLEGCFEEIEFGDVVTYLLMHSARIAKMLKPFIDREDQATKLPGKRSPVTGAQLADELLTYGRRVRPRRLRDWVAELDELGKLTIDDRPKASKFTHRKFTPEDVDELLEYGKHKDQGRVARGRRLGQRTASRRIA